MTRIKKQDSIDRLKEAYDLLGKVIRNPSKLGYIAIITKIAPKSRELINLKLFDFRSEIDREINYLTKRILRKIGFDKLPNGSKWLDIQ